MATIRLLLGIICFTALGGYRLPERGTVKHPEKPAISEVEIRRKLLTLASSQLGVREKSGRNDGKEVETYLRYVGLPAGHPWCAAFISWVFGQAQFSQPRSPWSPALFPLSRKTTQLKTGNLYAIYNRRLGRIAHCGLIEKQEGHWVIGIEGNTNVTGSREGDGVYRKRRHLHLLYTYADWLKGGDHEN